MPSQSESTSAEVSVKPEIMNLFKISDEQWSTPPYETDATVELDNDLPTKIYPLN